jgi:hypothetical protein
MVGKQLSNAPREDGSAANKLEEKESSHENQDECEGRLSHPVIEEQPEQI